MLDPLFSGISIGQAIDDQHRRVVADIAALHLDELLARDLDDLEAERVDLYRFDPLVLQWDARTPQSRDVDLKLDGDVDGEISDRTQSVRVKGTEITLSVPFSGTPGLFHMRPSTHTDDPPRGFVSGEKTLRLRYSYADAEPAAVQRELDRQVAAVGERVSSINNDVGPFNADLPGLVHAEIKARLDKLRADADVVAALGVPRRQRHTSSRGDIEPNTSGPADTHGQARVERYRTPGTSEPPEPRDLAPHTPRRGGRPKGPDLIQTRAEIENAYRNLWAEGGRRPYWNKVAHEMGVDERTLREARQYFRLDEKAIQKISE